MCRSYLVIAGDGRQRELVHLLKARGDKVEHINQCVEEKELGQLVEQCDTLILPIPVSKDKKHIFSDNESLKLSVASVFSALTEHQTVVAGGFDSNHIQLLKEKNIAFFDCMGEESFCIYNAFLTAQGALQLMLESSGDYLPGKRVLVTGYGRVGKACAALLKPLGCDVYVAARSKAQLMEAQTANCKTLLIEEIGGNAFLFDFVLNTVPCRIFSERTVGFFKEGSVYIELASSPFGADKAHFERSKAAFVSGASLPGRLCKTASAKAILGATGDFLAL